MVDRPYIILRMLVSFCQRSSISGGVPYPFGLTWAGEKGERKNRQYNRESKPLWFLSKQNWVSKRAAEETI